MKFKKVLIIVQNLSVPKDRRVWLEASALAAKGHNVTVLCPRDREELKSEIIEDVLIKRYSIPNNFSGIFGYLVEYVWSFLTFTLVSASLHLRIKYDVIQVCNPPDIFFPLGWFARITKTTFIFDQHDLVPELLASKFPRLSFLTRLATLLEGATCKTADVIICTNRSYAKLLHERHSVDYKKIWVVRNGPVISEFVDSKKPTVKQKHENLVVYCGAISRQDGVDYLIRAINEIVNLQKRVDVKFDIVGDGDALAEIKALTNKLGLDQYVRFTGWIERSEAIEHILSADLCVSPEPSSPLNDKSTFIKVLEYMAAGKPVVSFELAETLESAGKASLYAKPNDFKEMAVKMVEVLDSPEKREKMSKIATKRASTLLSWEFSKVIYLRAYQSPFLDSETAIESDHEAFRGWRPSVEKRLSS